MLSRLGAHDERTPFRELAFGVLGSWLRWLLRYLIASCRTVIEGWWKDKVANELWASP